MHSLILPLWWKVLKLDKIFGESFAEPVVTMTRSIVILEFENFIRDKLSLIIRVLLKWLWVVLIYGEVFGWGTERNNKIILSHNQL